MTGRLFTKDDQFHDLTNYVDKTTHLYQGSAALGAGLSHLHLSCACCIRIQGTAPSRSRGHAVRTFLLFLASAFVGFALAAWRACCARRAVRLRCRRRDRRHRRFGLSDVVCRRPRKYRVPLFGRWPLLAFAYSAGENPLSSSADRALRLRSSHLPFFFFCSCCAIAGIRRWRLAR